jgi:type I restriction enzyme S subunit
MEQLKKGYKKTEVGVIPEDWLISSIGDILSIKHGKDQKGVQNVNGQYPILGTGGVMGYTDSYLYNKESVLIGRKGTIDKPKFMNNPFWTVDTLFYSEIKNDVFAKYIYYKFLQINWYSYNEASGVPSLNAKTIEGINITIPPTLTEQKAIADALTDVDELITNLEKLIAKKKVIKQGAMQQLLTPPHKGGKRLDGFSGDWVEVTLSKLCENISSGKSNTTPNNGEYCLYGSTGIIGVKSYYDYKGPKILVARVGANAGSIYKVEGEYCVSDNTLMLTCNNSYDLTFAYFQLLTMKLNRLVFGSGQPLITGGQLKALNVSVPKIEEQKVIANTLIEIENEIISYERKLFKIIQIKQGMMQELLTGKTRIV